MEGKQVMKTFRIGNLGIGAGRCFIVMDVAQAHDGNLSAAHSFIDVASAAGADAVKFQTHIAEAESSPLEPFRVTFSKDKTRYDYWKRMEFTEFQWKELQDHALGKKLIFLSTPFSFEALTMLDRLGVPAWKVGSGEVTNLPLLEAMTKTCKPVLLSSGMSSLAELDKSVKLVSSVNIPLMIYQCTSSYPCAPAKVGLPLLAVLRERYDVPVGLSDHSGKVWFGVAAAALGAASVEVHMTMDRQSSGPDVPASLTPDELKYLVEGIRMVEESMISEVDKDEIAGEMSEMKCIFGRSVFTRTAMAAGTVLSNENVALKKPAGGISAEKFKSVLGRKLIRSLPKDAILKEDDIE
jgi:N-acetylneuraminate synthase